MALNQRVLILFVLLSVFTWPPAHCASSKNKNAASTQTADNNKKVVCYYTNWSAYRPGSAKFLPQNINPYLCTHLIYAFGGFTNDFQLRPFDKWQDIDQGGYAKFNGLKTHNKKLKTLLAIGGWNEGSQRFSKLVADAEARQNLVKSAIKYLRQHNFDGLDLDWEYPGSRDGSKDADRANYAQLVKELKEGFNKEKTNRDKLLLTMAVPAGIDTIEKGYDIKALNRDLDFINILSYDYHSSFEPQVNHHAPLLARSFESDEFDPNEELNVDATIQVYLLNGASPEKLVVGIPTYGRAYKLISSDQTALGSPAEGPAEPGKATREKGYLAYYEICDKITNEGWTVEKPDPDAIGPFASNGEEWVGYDDEEMVARKAQYVSDNNLGGIMFWSIDNDDFRGQCNGRAFPLIESAKAALFGFELPEIVPSDESSSGEVESPRSSTPSTALIRPSSTSLRRKENPNTKNEQQRTTTSRSSSSSGNFNPFTTPAPPTTPESLVDFTCTDEGFFPNPKDCKKYYWCLESGSAGLVQHVFTCPSGLHFNKFTDSCDYANNVGCTIGAVTTTTTTSPTTTARPRTTPARTASKPRPRPTTRTTTQEPDYDDERVDAVKKTGGDEDDPQELQQLLQLISDLGGVDAVKKLLERKTQRGGTKDGQQIQLTQAQRQALEKVIKPTISKTKQKELVVVQVEDEEEPVTTKRPNRLQHSLIERNRVRNQAARQESETERPAALSQGTRRPTIIAPTTTTTTTTTEEPFEEEEEEVFEEVIEEEPSTTPRALTARATTARTTTTTTTTEATTTPRRIAATRRRPLNSNPRSQSTASGSTPRVSLATEAPRAPIVIAIPAPVVRPGGEDVQKRPAANSRPAVGDQDDIDGSAEVIQVGHNANGNVVEIDEDGRVFCYDVGNFAYPDDCRKFVQCARSGGSGPIQGWVQTCPRILSFDPVGAICNWGSPVRCRQF